tara:strand:+ start:5631 stop:5834 length:204 start_codon:yes stop_codon:yes gene_type:complete
MYYIAHKTKLQSNIYYAYNLKLKQEYLKIIEFNKKYKNRPLNPKYGPQYFFNVYKTHRFPIETLKPN